MSEQCLIEMYKIVIDAKIGDSEAAERARLLRDRAEMLQTIPKYRRASYYRSAAQAAARRGNYEMMQDQIDHAWWVGVDLIVKKLAINAARCRHSYDLMIILITRCLDLGYPIDDVANWVMYRAVADKNVPTVQYLLKNYSRVLNIRALQVTNSYYPNGTVKNLLAKYENFDLHIFPNQFES